MTSVPLNETVPVVLNGAGGGTAKVGPLTAREVWHPSNASVKVSTITNEAQCLIYVGDSPTQANFMDGTYSGSSGDSSDRVGATTVRVGWYVWAVWTGGDPGATATLTVTGTKDV
ncbi:hypothetical protein [Actinomadura sp. NPDC048394]|uniref:hypothetical protein n=1 Tax=Actinomadura sp. NPDC048394 TaxID=3158223 RepID=UPI0033FB2996